MKRVVPLRVTAATLGGLAAATAGLAFCVIASIRAGEWLQGNSPSWAVPLIAGAAVGVLAWFLLSGARIDEGREIDSAETVACSACGYPVMSDWRLCPHCGSATGAGIGPKAA